MRPAGEWVSLRLLLVILLVVSAARGQTCSREPPDRTTAKSPGSGGFRVKLSGRPRAYIPGKIYTVKLMGWRTQYLSEKFTAFSLHVKNEATSSAAVREAGSLQLFGYGLAKMDSNCPNLVTQTSTVPKTEAEVLWMAPPAGAGCVLFQAVVVRSRYVWFMDDENLTLRLCEDESTDRNRIFPQQTRPEPRQQRRTSTNSDPDATCCACDEAKYKLTFEGLWSKETHPKDFPRNAWLMHFSDILVASHVPEESMWREGSLASDGLKQVAEWGYTRQLEQELKAKGAAMRSVTRAKGLWHPNVLGTTSTDFRVDKKRHIVSAVTMLGPSPDWILGISGFDLCLKNCSWLEEKEVDLGLYDAGTDSGVSYESPNAPLSPRQPVRAISASWPSDPAGPFYRTAMAPVARLKLTRQRVIPRACHLPPEGSANDDAGVEDHAEPEDTRPECMVTPWSDWSSCSVTCGEGLSMRTREYKLPMKADMMMCKRQLVEKVLCDAPLTCDGRPQPTRAAPGDSGICALTSWTRWSPCSATCGAGVRMRRRNYIDRMGRKKCFKPTEEKEKCMGEQAECPDPEPVDSRCPVTDWSEWSPCSVTCGSGQRVKTRLLLVDASLRHQCSHITLMQKEGCVAERADCKLDMHEAKKVCMMENDPGPCRGTFQRWYFEPRKGMCVPFVYSGCRGNRNNFDSVESCSASCSIVAELTGSTPPAPPSHSPDPVDCMVTPWSPWSQCTSSCGRGRQRKTRMIKVRPRHGGRPCPRRLERYRRCRFLPPCY